MELDLGKGFYEFSSRGYDYQRCINWFPSNDSSGEAKTRTRLLSTPGLSHKVTVSPNNGLGCRGLYETSGGRVFGVWGNTLFEIDINFTATDRNSSLRFSRTFGRVSFADNGTQLIIIDQGKGYILTLSSNAFAQITDADYPANANQVTFKDGYFVVSVPGTKTFYQSDLNDGTSWNALSFGSIVSSPDNISGITSTNTDLVLFGEDTVEQWQNIGDTPLTFERINGATLDIGCRSPWSIAKINNSIYFLGSNKNGFGIVWRISSYQVQKISTPAIESIIGGAGDDTDAIAYTYQEKGYYFYVLTVPSLDRTFVYEETTNKWHERAYWDSSEGEFIAHKSNSQVFAFGKNLVGYDGDNNLYELDDLTYTDNGDEIRRVMSTPHIHHENRRVSVNQLKLEYERGTALTSGQGSDPVIWMKYSKDGGYTWSDEVIRKMGAKGNYSNEISWNRLGCGRDYVFELAMSDPVKSDLYALYIDLEVLRT